MALADPDAVAQRLTAALDQAHASEGVHFVLLLYAPTAAAVPDFTAVDSNGNVLLATVKSYVTSSLDRDRVLLVMREALEQLEAGALDPFAR